VNKKKHKQRVPESGKMATPREVKSQYNLIHHSSITFSHVQRTRLLSCSLSIVNEHWHIFWVIPGKWTKCL